MSTNQMNNKPPQSRSGVAGWITFAIAIVLVVAGMAALGGLGQSQTGDDPDFDALFATYFSDLDAAQASGQIQAEGIYQNLRKKGEDAQGYVTAGERDKALNELNALLNELSAMAGNQVAEPDAGKLITDVQAIIDGLNQVVDTPEPETATAEDVSPEGLTSTPGEITETPTAELDTVTSSPTPPNLSPTWSPTPPSGSFTVDHYQVGCSLTVINGRLSVNTPAVRATVNLASNLGVMLAEATVPPNGTIEYQIILTYPRQPEGTRLIVAVGEWDGAKFINPATLQGFDCTDTPGGTGTALPQIAIATVPPITLTGGGYTETWTISIKVIDVQGECPDFADTTDQVVTGRLEFGVTDELVAIGFLDRRWQMSPSPTNAIRYEGSLVSWDTTQKMEDTIVLTVLSADTFEAREVFTFTMSDGSAACRIDSRWAGSRQP